MLILTNGLADVVDEGFLKVANNLVIRLRKQARQSLYIITYERMATFSDKHLKLNKLLLNRKLISLIRARKENVLYIPFPANEWATALRTFILSVMCKRKLTIVLTMLCECNFIGRLLFKMSGATIVTFSQSAKDIYEKMVGNKNVQYLKTGVDTERFVPVSNLRKIELRKNMVFLLTNRSFFMLGI